MQTPVVTLLTDFGEQDSYVAEMKAVLVSARRDTAIIDICHTLPPYEIRWAAFQLLRSYHHFPGGSWHLAVVDPGVGTARKAVYARCGPHHFVGPDNGLLLWAVQDAEQRYKEEAKVFALPQQTAKGPTFHGRDLFAPFVAAGITNQLPNLTQSVQLIGDDFPGCRELDGVQRGAILGADRFGNVISSIPWTSDTRVEAQIEEREDKHPFADNYSAIEEGKVGLIRGSHGFWEFACQKDSAWEKMKVRFGTEVTIYPLE